MFNKDMLKGIVFTLIFIGVGFWLGTRQKKAPPISIQPANVVVVTQTAKEARNILLEDRDEACKGQTDLKKKCEAEEGKKWSCLIGACLTPVEVERIALLGEKCKSRGKVGKDLEACIKEFLPDLKKYVELVAPKNGACSGSEADEQACVKQGRVWNCSVKACISGALNFNELNYFDSCSDQQCREHKAKEIRLYFCKRYFGNEQCFVAEPEISVAISCEADGKSVWLSLFKVCVPNDETKMFERILFSCVQNKNFTMPGTNQIKGFSSAEECLDFFDGVQKAYFQQKAANHHL